MAVAMNYIGSRPELQGLRAMVMSCGNSSKIKAQFNTCEAHPELCFNWHEFDAQDFLGKYRITTVTLPGLTMYRVSVAATGEESQLYSWEDCLDIVELGLKGELMGSFDIGVNHGN